jgi:hypothetical protein
VSDELQKGRESLLKERFVDVRLHSGELPDLAVFKCDLENSRVRFIGECLDFRIEDRNCRNPQGRNEVPAVLYLLFALSAKDHGREVLFRDSI